MAQFLFIARGTERTPQVEVERLGRSEAAVVWDGIRKGLVRASAYLEHRRGAVLLLECTDRNEAEAFVGRLPMIAADIVEHELLLLEPYVGLERLFETSVNNDGAER